MSNGTTRRFILHRLQDVTGVSGIGVVAEGVTFTDGTTVIRWSGATPSTVVWAHVDDAMKVHGHGGKTELVWLDDEGVRFPVPEYVQPAPPAEEETWPQP